MTSKNIIILPGDGIGPEISKQATKIIDALNKNLDINVNYEIGLVGGASIDEHNTPITEDTMEKAMKSDAVVLGCVGGPKWDNVERHLRPECGLLRLRKDLDLFANLRPAFTFDALVEKSTLKPEIVSKLDIMIVRELTSGVYFGKPRGKLDTKEETYIDTQIYSRSEIERVTEVAFDIAKKRGKLVHSVEKSNVMETGLFWKNVVTQLHKNHPEINLQHMLADNCAMQLIKNPKQFDVILTDNLFGDMLSDCAAMATGSLGMLASASMGNSKTSCNAMYEPVHGSAPDIAGQNIANPCAMILSIAMMYKYSFDRDDVYKIINNAVESVLNQKIFTKDLDCNNFVNTDEMGDAIINHLKF